MLVEEPPALFEGNAERFVLVAVPADGRLHDEPALAEDVERAELLGEQERVAERRDHGARRQPQARRGGSDRGEQHDRARPRHRRILIAGQRVVARVAHHAVRTCTRAQHDVLAHHHRVEPRPLGDDRHLARALEGHAAV